MPTVPMTQGPTVERAPTPDARRRIRAAPDTFGAAVGEGIVRSGGAGVEFYEEQRKKADFVRMLEVDSKLASYQSELEAKVRAAEGRNALGVRQDVMEEWQSFTGTLQTELASESQRIQFQRIATTRRDSLERAAILHSSAEFDRYQDEMLEAGIKNHAGALVSHAYDDQRRQLEAAGIEAKLQQFAANNGRSPEWVAQKRAEVMGEAHANVIERYLTNGDDDDARNYMEAHRDELGPRIVAVERAVEEGTRLSESRRQAEAILARHPGNLSAALDAARSIDDVRVADMARQRIRQAYSDREAAESMARREAVKAAQSYVERGGNPLNLSPGLLSQLSSSQRSALETRFRQVAEGIEPPHDSFTWLKAQAMSQKELASLTEEDLWQRYRHRLDNTHWDRLVSTWSTVQAIKRGEKAGENSVKLTTTLNFKDVVSNGLRSAGYIPPHKSLSQLSRNEAELYDRFESEAAAALEQFEMQELGGKRKATTTEVQRVVDGLLKQKVFVDPGMLTRAREMPAVVVQEDQSDRAYVPLGEIPQEDRSRIENLIRSNGRPISTGKVERAYAQYLLGDRAAFDVIIEE